MYNFRDQHYAFGVGLLAPIHVYRKESEQDKGRVTKFNSTKWLCQGRQKRLL